MMHITFCDRNISLIITYTVLTDRILNAFVHSVQTWRHNKIEPASLNVVNACLHDGDRRKGFLATFESTTSISVQCFFTTIFTTFMQPDTWIESWFV